MEYYILFGAAWASCFIGMYFNAWVSGSFNKIDDKSALEMTTRDHIVQFKKLDKLINFYGDLNLKEKIICVSFGFGLFIFATVYGLYWYLKYLAHRYFFSR